MKRKRSTIAALVRASNGARAVGNLLRLKPLEIGMAKSVEGRLRDACFTAFMRGKEEHADWMNDVLPMVDREIAAAIREDRAEMVSERDAACESEAQATDCAREAHAIVARVWKALGISNYADAQGKAIDEIVADLLKSHKAGLAERREEELREDERLGKAMARAEIAEAALTIERQRREEAEAALLAWQDRFNQEWFWRNSFGDNPTTRHLAKYNLLEQPQ